MHTPDNDKAPLFRSWTGWYLLLIIFLAILIFLFYLLTKKYA
ncbi:MAG: hypothetical protein NTW29_21555 [Bacteroidetes bacterium]|nr:hypothetical protein [Bacteroidota bacterium]